MKRALGLVAVLICSVLICSAMVAPPRAVAAPTVWTYPSAACPASAAGLQACVDGAAAGDTVKLAVDTDEAVTLSKSLTLRSAGRSRHRLWIISAFQGSGSAPIDLTVKDLVVRSEVRTRFLGAGTNRLTMSNVEVSKGTPGAYGTSVEVANGTVAVRITKSYLATDGHQDSSLSFYLHDGGRVQGVVDGNTITQHLSPSNDSGSGISVITQGASPSHLSFYNNLVWDVDDNASGLASAIAVAAYSGGGQLKLDLVNNTVEKLNGGSAVGFRNDSTTPIRLLVNAYNNVFGHGRGLGGEFGATIHAGANRYHDMQYKDGAADLHAQRSLVPGFLKPKSGNFALTRSSDLRDRGVACQAGGLGAVDASGRFRFAGRSVDIGAHEYGAPKSIGKVIYGDGRRNHLRGTGRPDILCGFAGGDILKPGKGADYVDGGAGRDIGYVARGDRVVRTEVRRAG